MTQEDKQLLLIDLCGRLPHGVKVQVADYKTPVELSHINIKNGNGRKPYCFVFAFEPERVKPYLRPMSSMTEEEKVQLSQYACIGEDLNGEFIDEVQRKDCAAYIDWLNKKMFDYRGLIPKGLALPAPKGMYK